MQGWLDSDWWLTALPQQYVRFRGDSSQDMVVFLTVGSTFLEKGDRGNTAEVGKDNIKPDLLNELEIQSLWFKRDYTTLLKGQADKLKLDLKETALIYGEINLPTYGEPLVTQKFIYNEQLGLTKE
jgi:CRISPR-associated endonuclease/helicase Cas3